MVAVDRVERTPGEGLVYEHGWQSWSPSGVYPADASSPRPFDEVKRTMGYRPGVHVPPGVFQGEGLLAIQAAVDAPVHLYAAPAPRNSVPSIRAEVSRNAIDVSADGPVAAWIDEGYGGLAGALARYAERLAVTLDVPQISAAPPMWCSWYCYYDKVQEADVVHQIDVMEKLELPVEVVQIDDGYQAEIGDWLTPSSGFTSVTGFAKKIRDRGRRAGIWTAPFFAGAKSTVAKEHPDWFVPDCAAGSHWGQKLRVLDVTHPRAAEHLVNVFTQLAAAGYDYFKLDFLYAGALPGRRHQHIDTLDAYRRGVELIRSAVGPKSTLLGCGAPILPSIGLFDIMRVSPDVACYYNDRAGDMSSPSMRAALLTGRARAFQHARWWINDPDCLIVRPEVERRVEWADHVRASGQVASSDFLDELDEWGLSTTRDLLRPSTTTPPQWIVDLDGEQGRVAQTDV